MEGAVEVPFPMLETCVRTMVGTIIFTERFIDYLSNPSDLKTAWPTTTGSIVGRRPPPPVYCRLRDGQERGASHY
jgi:hypothetical protein